MEIFLDSSVFDIGVFENMFRFISVVLLCSSIFAYQIISGRPLLVRILRCGHVFHEECLRDALRSLFKCGGLFDEAEPNIVLQEVP